MCIHQWTCVLCEETKVNLMTKSQSTYIEKLPPITTKFSSRTAQKKLTIFFTFEEVN